MDSKKSETLDMKYADIISDLLFVKSVTKMNDYIQHSDISCLRHCLHVSFMSYLISKKLKFDETSCRNIARGALLHDMFLYDWHKKHKYGKLHGFTHPSIALRRAEKNISDLNDCQKDIILNHMWPLTIYRLPKHKETYIVMLTDKICTVLEVFKINNIKMFNNIDKLI